MEDYIHGKGESEKGSPFLKFTRKGDKMRLLENEDGRSVILTEKQMGHTLANFYRCVAKEAGHEETEETMYDCTKILVAPDVQDAIIQAYQEKWPDAPMDAIIIRLAMSGPKVRDNLRCGEVMIQKGFIFMRNDR